MHQAAPITVRVIRLQGWQSVRAQCDGKRVSDQQFLVSEAQPMHVAWARAFLDGVRSAPMVAGVRP
jgi:hypothetical protein